MPVQKLVSPAMNTRMYENPITQDNLDILRKYGFTIIEPSTGYLACGDTGAGKFPDPEIILEYVYQELACEKDMAGLHVLVTAGPTQESIDPVRYITNHSTGKWDMRSRRTPPGAVQPLHWSQARPRSSRLPL